MAVTVEPASFTYVDFDAAEIAAITEELAGAIGLEGDITVEVDESTPLGGTELKSVEPIVVFFESGALEDPKAPRKLHRDIAAATIGRLLFRARDRLDPAFGDPPDDSELSLPQHAVWDSYAMGRLGRLGYRAQRQRRLYQFRTRLGFSDETDAAFERVWNSDDLTWDDLQAIADTARALA